MTGPDERCASGPGKRNGVRCVMHFTAANREGCDLCPEMASKVKIRDLKYRSPGLREKPQAAS